MKHWKTTSLCISAAMVIAGFLVVHHVQLKNDNTIHASKVLTEEQRVEAQRNIQQLQQEMFLYAESMIGQIPDEQLMDMLDDDASDFMNYLQQKTQNVDYLNQHPEIMEFLQRHQTIEPILSI